jgi:hypothetical protein
MSNVIEFPKHKVRAKTSPKLRAVPPLAFRADLFLMPGDDVAFSIIYPRGPISRKLVAAMLRRAARSIDPIKPTRQ